MRHELTREPLDLELPGGCSFRLTAGGGAVELELQSAALEPEGYVVGPGHSVPIFTQPGDRIYAASVEPTGWVEIEMAFLPLEVDQAYVELTADLLLDHSYDVVNLGPAAVRVAYAAVTPTPDTAGQEIPARTSLEHGRRRAVRFYFEIPDGETVPLRVYARGVGGSSRLRITPARR